MKFNNVPPFFRSALFVIWFCCSSFTQERSRSDSLRSNYWSGGDNKNSSLLKAKGDSAYSSFSLALDLGYPEKFKFSNTIGQAVFRYDYGCEAGIGIVNKARTVINFSLGYQRSSIITTSIDSSTFASTGIIGESRIANNYYRIPFSLDIFKLASTGKNSFSVGPFLGCNLFAGYTTPDRIGKNDIISVYGKLKGLCGGLCFNYFLELNPEIQIGIGLKVQYSYSNYILESNVPVHSPSTYSTSILTTDAMIRTFFTIPK